MTRVAVLVTLCRIVFATVLLPWFVVGGLTRISGLALSVGPPAGVWPLSLGAYYAFAPDLAVRGEMPGLAGHVFVLTMTMGELVLPVLVVLGLFGRTAASLLIAHLWIGAIVTGGLTGQGTLFDVSPFDAGPDRLQLWSMVLLPVALFGAGPLSADGLIRHLRGPRASPG